MSKFSKVILPFNNDEPVFDLIRTSVAKDQSVIAMLFIKLKDKQIISLKNRLGKNVCIVSVENTMSATQCTNFIQCYGKLTDVYVVDVLPEIEIGAVLQTCKDLSINLLVASR
jgi:hypothetical protein